MQFYRPSLGNANLSIQVTEDPVLIPKTDTELVLVYASNSIEVRKEEEAYSFLSLVADVGGVLGLFIGFNFLMVWDWMVGTLIFVPKLLAKAPTDR